MIKNLALSICLALAVALAWWTARPPPTLGPDAPAGLFSAGRAMVDDRVIARTPHPVGSAANGVVRDYLIHRLRALGLDPQVQRTVAFMRSPRAPQPVVLGATVENIVAVLPGRDRTAPAVALMAHYDSVPASPGAADDAAGVSSVLEMVRILKADGPPARDVIILITDGEEAGLLGAEGFFRENPLARRIGYLINLESRGGGGLTHMFQTGPQNGEVIRQYAKAALHPEASSLLVFLYEHLPNDTDFTVSKAAGVTGLNLAFMGRQFDYHSPTSTSDNLDQSSLQHMGDQALSAARAVSAAPTLPGRSPNLVYATTLGRHLLVYPQAAGWALLGLAALIAIGVWRAKRRGAFVWSDVARGLGGTLYLAATSIVLLRLARHATGAAFGFLEQRFLLAQVTRWEIVLLLICVGAGLYAATAVGRGRSRIQAALLAVLAGAGCSAFGLDIPGLAIGGAGALIALFSFGKPAGVAGAWTGLLATGVVAGIALQAYAAPAAFVIAWPLLIAALCGAATALGTVRPPWLAMLMVAPAAIGLGWAMLLGHHIFLGLDLVELLALIIWLGAMLVWPLAQPESEARGARLAALILLLIGFVGVAAVRMVPPWTPRYPEATVVNYVVDPQAGKAMLTAVGAPLDAWSASVLKADGATPARTDLPVVSRTPVWSAAAKLQPVTAPEVSLVRQPDGALVVTATPPPGAETLSFDVRSSTRLSETTVNGRPVPVLDKPGQWTRFRFTAVPEGITLRFRSTGPGAIDTRYAAQFPGWPAAARPLPARPANVMAFGGSDTTLAIGARRFTW